MKIVYCHNYYRHRGGEDVSFECDLQLLRDRGHQVVAFTRDNHDLSSRSPRTISKTIWNRQTEREMHDVLTRERPDVLHCNNLFPMISPSVYRAASRLRIPIVQAVRNYRNLCANSFLFRDGSVCQKCLHSALPWHAIRHRCYRDSAAATGVVVAAQLANRVFKIQQRYVNAFFAPTEFARQIHLQAGYPKQKFFRRSNFILPDLGAQLHKEDYALFVGRLSPEKGISTIVSAWRHYNIEIPLQIVGEGPEEATIREQTQGMDHVRCVGQLPTDEVLQRIAGARFLIISSQWFETFGRTIAEAFSRGTPVIGSNLGAMAELIQDGENGFLFEAGNPASLQAVVQRLDGLSSEKCLAMRERARASYDESCSPAVSYRELMSVYEHAMQYAAVGTGLTSPLCVEKLGT
jgi:glycosyltransferase involved in cell wall biosynthesis